MFRLIGCGSKYWEAGARVVHGVSFLEEKENRQLYRAGPAVPIFSAPNYCPLLVTQKGKEMLVRDDFLGLSFQEVDYANVVDIDWHTWELDEEVPDDQCASDFGSIIMDESKHREDLLLKMPRIYEVMTELVLDVEFTTSVQVDLSSHQGQRLVNCVDINNQVIFPLVSDRGREWFLKNGDEWLEFSEANKPAAVKKWTSGMFFEQEKNKE